MGHEAPCLPGSLSEIEIFAPHLRIDTISLRILLYLMQEKQSEIADWRARAEAEATLLRKRAAEQSEAVERELTASRSHISQVRYLDVSRVFDNRSLPPVLYS